ncbi:hypothetical protein C7H79_05850 [Nitrosomonas supralitoralis]|uniref:Cupin type-1 domain-containing protein n=2 Tax=Nitrosomonas supralitoralis TaxID=2116706 RepID=A0A2P7NWQ6_9PROT|nr:hypothetical protein C7H79_05850 [Nitrosomonas supralitoralis]
MRKIFTICIFTFLFCFSFSAVYGADGFVLKAGEGEAVMNGMVIKASPSTGTANSILVEQTFQKGGTTGLHIHDQGDELFYVVSGDGLATLGSTIKEISAGDVIFVPAGIAHKIENLKNSLPLVVVFFMDSPELVEEFRAIQKRTASQPDKPLTSEELAEIRRIIGGSRVVEMQIK